MNRDLFTIHEIKTREDGEPMFAVLPGDGAAGLVIGEIDEVAALRDRLDAFLRTQQPDGKIDAWDERLGHEWLTVGEASREYGIPAVTISWSCRNGHIQGAVKQGRYWQFPKAQFRWWLNHRPAKGPKPQKSA